MKSILEHFLRPWLLALLMPAALLIPAWSVAQIDVGVSVDFAPPELPVYDQPPIPEDGYIWTPGYWAWSDDAQDYYWVPGTWVPPPQPEYLWTPGYWAVAGAVFFWHPGYWGPHVGFYGGIDYGWGYTGNGYYGGYWRGGRLFYNRAVNNVDTVRVTNVYNTTVVNNITVNRVSYNGGNGVRAAPTATQLAAANERHIEATPLQRQHIELARGNVLLHATQNQGIPTIAATARPAAFKGASVVPARADNAANAANAARRANQPGDGAYPRAAAPAARQAQEQQRQAPTRSSGDQWPEQRPPQRPAQPQQPHAVETQRAYQQQPRIAEPSRPVQQPRVMEQPRPAEPRYVAPPHPAAPTAPHESRPQPAVHREHEPEH